MASPEEVAKDAASPMTTIDMKADASSVGVAVEKSPPRSSSQACSVLAILASVFGLLLLVGVAFVSCATLYQVVRLPGSLEGPPAGVVSVEVPMDNEQGFILHYNNYCNLKKPIHADPAKNDQYFKNVDCLINGVIQVLEQSATNVTAGYQGLFNVSGRMPITEPYWKVGLCPVNVHWHLGAEHFSVGEYDEAGNGPDGKFHEHRRKLSAASGEKVPGGHLCHKYDAKNAAFTTEYNWKHCIGLQVGQTYEVHWPHSAAGACGTPNQYQTPFYDGVFCRDGIISLDPLNTYKKIGVQAQVYTIINDENYYYPDLIRGMIVDGEMGKDLSIYTGSTTGETRDDEVCSRYTPITWQVDRKCHLISASSFDKMCADMKSQRDDMSDDLYAHGSRELVDDYLSANNHVDGTMQLKP